MPGFSEDAWGDCSARADVIGDSIGDVNEGCESALAQAALRRIAVLAARGEQPHALYAVVAEELGRVVAAPSVAIARYAPDGTATVCGTFPPADPRFPARTRVPVERANVLGLVWRRAESARVDNHDELEGEITDPVRRSGMSSSVGVPIVVDGRVWGAIVVSDTEGFAETTEARLAEFTELLAAAIENAEARAALARLADEQAALRRVATLVAQDVAPAEIFAAVSAEVGGIFRLDPTTSDIAAIGRFEPGSELVVVGVSNRVDVVPLGSRFPPHDLFAATQVLGTGRSARIGEEQLATVGGEMADFLRHHGYLSQVASPIFVDGRLWGSMSVNARNDLPPDTEERLGRFTELVAVAIANVESRRTLAQLAREQAAVSRVATLVAKEDLPEKVFAKVAEETGCLLRGVECTLVRNERDGAATNVWTWGERISAAFPLNTRFFPEGDGVAATVLRTGRPHRIDDYSAVADPIARTALDRGIESSVGCPIVVGGAIWGAILVGTTGAEPFPPEAEMRLTQFADLVATAIANTESRKAEHALAEEQRALRRVATLVARDPPPGEVFDAVAMEVGNLLDTDITVVGRYDADGAGTAIGSWSAVPGGVPVGTRSAIGGHNVMTLVKETERPARIDGYGDDTSGEAAEIARHHGWRSSIAAPISVEGRLWGVMLVATQRPDPFPADAEKRLSAFTDLVATAIANAESRSELDASRRRIVAAGDEVRRRIERDLHDGIQQRLIALTFGARAMTRRPPEELRGMAAELLQGLRDVSDELREVSRGIHPTILTEAGLGPALRALARRSTVPIDLDVRLDERLPPSVEVAAYYIASEALTNVAKHAQANVVKLTAAHEHGVLTLEVRDDGIGGADTTRGSGILGLMDRIGALGGTISIASAPRGGTTLSARLRITT